MAESLKEISYRGGVVKFKIPSDWKEEYESNGGGTFYKDAPNTGTLRLNIITMQAPTDAKGNLSVQALSTISGVEPNTIEPIKDGDAIAHFIERTKEQNTDITLYWWYVAKHIPPNHVRMANFSYTILTSQENSDSIIKEIKLLEHEIKNTIFHTELGE